MADKLGSSSRLGLACYVVGREGPNWGETCGAPCRNCPRQISGCQAAVSQQCTRPGLPRQTWLGARSGPTHFFSAGTCVNSFSYAGSMPTGSKLSTSGSNSTAAACLNLCSTTARCQTAVLTTENSCQLYSTLAGARTSSAGFVFQCGDYGTEPATWP